MPATNPGTRALEELDLTQGDANDPATQTGPGGLGDATPVPDAEAFTLDGTPEQSLDRGRLKR